MTDISKERIGGEMIDDGSRRSGISIKSLVSLVMLCAGAWLVPSGIALHFATHEGAARWGHLFMSMHNAASMLLVAAVAAHLILNWKVLTRYISARAEQYLQVKRELLIAVIGVSGFVLLVASHALHLS